VLYSSIVIDQSNILLLLLGGNVAEKSLDKGGVLLGDGLLVGLLCSALLASQDSAVVSGELGVRVKAKSESVVDQRVTSHGVHRCQLGLLSADLRLDLVRVQQTAEVGVGNQRAGQLVVNLAGRVLAVGSVDLVQLLEGRLGPHAETTDVTSGGELEEVETCNVDSLNSGEVSECLEQLGSLS